MSVEKNVPTGAVERPADITLGEIEAARRLIDSFVVTTPVTELVSKILLEQLGEARVFMKLELLQRTGSFKARAALLNMLAMSPEERERGVTAVSAGNHAIAVAYAAYTLGMSAKVVMIGSPNPYRVDQCRSFGATIELAPNAHAAFERVDAIVEHERRVFIHPFEGRRTAIGTATVGLELTRQVDAPLDAVIVPVGGGGLCAGISTAIKLVWPACDVYGVEPEGADSMQRSFAAGSPQRLDQVRTIADSLGAPYALPISFALCREHVRSIELVSDGQLRAAMRVMQRECKLAVEPAGAAAMAALLGPLAERLKGRRVGLIVCGSNIDSATYCTLMGEQT